jgi:hypothetical protein
MAKTIDMTICKNAEIQHEIDAIETAQKWRKWCKKARAEGLIK